MPTDIPVVVKPSGIFRADFYDDLIKQKAKWREENKERLRADAFNNEQMTRQMVRHLLDNTKMDSTQTNFVARSLIYTLRNIKMISHKEAYDVAELVFPFNREGGTGLDSINYQELDLTGEFKPIAGSGTDLPEVGSTLTETPNPVISYGAAMGWTQRDAERAVRANGGGSGGPVDLQGRKRLAVAKAGSKKKQQIAWNGDPDGRNINGYFDYALNPVTIGGTWASATPEAIRDDFKEIIEEGKKDTGEWDSDILAMDTLSKTYVTKALTYNGPSIAQWLLNNTTCQAIVDTSYLDSVTSSINSLSANRVVTALPRTPEVVEFMLPRDIQYFPVQVQGFHYQVPVIFDTAGLFLYAYGTGGPCSFAIPT